MEHIERTGIHSGDSISVYPAKEHHRGQQEDDRGIHREARKGAPCKGMINIQFIVNDEGIFIIEVNPRSSEPFRISVR